LRLRLVPARASPLMGCWDPRTSHLEERRRTARERSHSSTRDVFPRAVVSQTCLRNQQMFGSSTSFTSSILPTFHHFLLYSSDPPILSTHLTLTTRQGIMRWWQISLSGILCVPDGVEPSLPKQRPSLCGFLIVWDSSLTLPRRGLCVYPSWAGWEQATGGRSVPAIRSGVRARPCSVVSLSSYATSVLNGGARSEDGWRARSY
jgi:hypothetical protein